MRAPLTAPVVLSGPLTSRHCVNHGLLSLSLLFGCAQVGYWNENEKYVNTVVYVPVVEEFYGLQNKTYVVTTILVGPRAQVHYTHALHSSLHTLNI